MNNQISDSVKHQILDQMEFLENEVTALRAISGLLNGCSSADSVEPGELCYLLDPIVDRQKAIVEEVRRLFGWSTGADPVRRGPPAHPNNNQT